MQKLFLAALCVGLTACSHLSKPVSETAEVPAPQSAALTSRQIDRLADRILENTPEHIHWAEGTRFSWLVLSPDIQKNPARLNRAVINKLQKKYTVYADRHQIPAELISRNELGGVVGYRGGFSFSFQVSFEEQDLIKVQYSDRQGPLAGSYHWKKYRWTGANWEMVEKSLLIVS